MATPLSAAPINMLNTATPSTSHRSAKLETDTHTNSSSEADGNASSPFRIEVPDSKTHSPAKENVSPSASPSKIRHSRILSGSEIAPLRILSPRDEVFEIGAQPPLKQEAPPKSPRKPVSPEKRFPVKVSSSASPEKLTEKSPEKSPETLPEKSLEMLPELLPESSPPKVPLKSPERAWVIPTVIEKDMSLEDALRANEGLEQAIQIFEDESTILENGENDADLSSISAGCQDAEIDDEAAGGDDTMVSTFSTFSAVPNMTMFARIGHSPTRFANMGLTPSNARGRSTSRTPCAPVTQDSGNTTSLMDFTEQLSGLASSRYNPSPSRRGRQSPTRANHPSATPQHPSSNSNLLDFDIPPLPTPRSVPTVTAREVETLKSAFLSEISSLKASLLGKEAEVNSLKSAMGDAEKRVGTCMEQLRETRCLKDALAEERDSWEKRRREMETVLRKVKSEIVMGQRDRDDLESKLDESEKRREAAEMMAQEAESKMAGMRAGKATSDGGSDASGKSPEKDPKSPGSREVEIAVERVARELHALYKSKHENKVSALKKSYENRWEKRVRDLEAKIEDLSEDNDRLKLGRDATMTRLEPGQAAANEERKVQAVKDSAQIKELNAEIQSLGAVVKSVKQDNQELILLLEKERVEKGELVSLAEEMMAMQHSFVQKSPARAPASTPTTPARRVATKASDGPQTARTITRPGPSGLRAPGTLTKPQPEKRISGPGHERTKSGGLPRPGGGLGMRSGIMSSIEKMGNYRGRGV
jgi:hypothetical protein